MTTTTEQAPQGLANITELIWGTDYVLVRRGPRSNLHAAVPTLNRSGYLTACGRRMRGADVAEWQGLDALDTLEREPRHCPRCRAIGDQVPL